MKNMNELLYNYSISLSRIQGNKNSDCNVIMKNLEEVLRLEEQVFSMPGMIPLLKEHIFKPVNPGVNEYNYTYPAGLLLARSGHPESAPILLDAVKSREPWCETQARNNLSWLKSTNENLDFLKNEYSLQVQKGQPEVPPWLIINALAAQRSAGAIGEISSYLTGSDDVNNRVWAFVNLAAVYPELGLALAEDFCKKKILYPSSLGIQAVYFNNEDVFRSLLECKSPDNEKLKWLGRIPCLESLQMIIKSLNQLDKFQKVNSISSLSLFGFKKGYEVVAGCLFDESSEVSAQAVAVLFDLLDGDEQSAFSQTWTYDDNGLLSVRSRDNLAAAVMKKLEGMNDSCRYYKGSLLLLEDQIDYLYQGFLLHHTWFQWVSVTGKYAPFDINKNILYNYAMIEKLEEWFSKNKDQFLPGGVYCHGLKIE